MEKMILLIEDNPDDEALTRKALPDHVVVTVRDGAEALDFLFETGQYKGRDMSLPVLVLLDLKLPKVDGLEVLRRIKNNPKTQTIPVIIWSASTDDRDIAESYAQGANSYIVKPSVFREYSEKLNAALGYWLDLNMLPPARPT